MHYGIAIEQLQGRDATSELNVSTLSSLVASLL